MKQSYYYSLDRETRKTFRNQRAIKKRKLRQNVSLVVAIILAAITIFPLLFLLINSFKSQGEIVDTPMALPKRLDFSNIIEAIKEINLVRGFSNTLLITMVAVTVIVLVSSFAAWMMVRCKIKIAHYMFYLFAMAMLIPFQSVMYPLIKFMDSIGLKNFNGLIVMYIGFGLSLSISLYHGFIKSVPASLEEAAVIDGANVFQLFFNVVFPMVKPTTVTVIILNAMWIWNDYLLPFLVIGTQEEKRTITLELYFAKLASGYGNSWNFIFPSVLVAILPIVILFLILQKHIMAGVGEGAVKG